MNAPKQGQGRSSVDPDQIARVLQQGGKRGAWRWLKFPLAAGALMVLAAAIWWGAFSGQGGSQTSYRTDAAVLSDITVIVTATGTLEPTKKVDISSELSGIIRTVKVDYNSPVKSGQVLAELDTDKLEASIASSRARLAAARARVTEAQATVAEKQLELERKQALSDRRVVAQQDLDTARAAFHRAEAALASAQADVQAAEADLKLEETNLAKTCICSPIDGTVLARNVDPGQVVAASLQAPVLFTIAEDLSSMEVQVDVDEADVGKVREGQQASFTVDAYPDRKFSAEISQLRYGSEVIQGVVTYKAVLTAENDDLLLRPGMTATAEIVVQSASGVLSISNEALRYSPPVAEQDDRSFLEKLLPGRPRFRSSSPQLADGPERVIWRLEENGKAEEVKVKIGISDGRRTQLVEGGIEAGDKVILEAVTPRN
ncbi:MAG: efflux RND transporter periplasmic adaptor subunit [Anderseniella sp.]|jgi:HlyD family secretion protein|nr:efflux RND transporter periplasmic adaptor subunit [Anderseniella sp.]